MNARPRVSVVIATFQRPALLARLLGQLADQSLPPGELEVVVVDDGSPTPVRPAVEKLALPFALRIFEQKNAGAAAARHRGITEAAGEIIVITDDDMQLGHEFLVEHLRHHARGERVVVLGRIRADPSIAEMPLFERWHQEMLDAMDRALRSGRRKPRGMDLFTGNVSMRREDYLRAGGFDHALGASEDAELGLRLEKYGARFIYAPEALVLHGSDHTNVARWRKRARAYGRFDLRVARKHPDAPSADPWRFFFRLHWTMAPGVGFALALPRAAGVASRAAYLAGSALERAGLARAALRAATVSYAFEYFSGLREESGSMRAVVRGLTHFVELECASRVAPFERALRALRADHAAMQRNEAHYGHRAPSNGSLARDLVHRVGLQILAGYRLMRALYEADLPLGARIVSRLVRHAYAADIHWEAELAPGIAVVHGMGLAVSHAARVGPGCILFQNVTLGMGADPVTGAIGAPSLDAEVHVGPGATLIGPITIGEHCKVAPSAVVTSSMPAHAVAAPPPLLVRARRNEPRSNSSQEVSA